VPPTDTPVTVYSTSWCGDCRAAKRALDGRGIPYLEIDIEHDEAARSRVEALNGGRRSVPTLVHGEAVASLSRFTPSKLEAFLLEAGLVEPAEAR
jgi:mycoredoxin